VSRISEVDAPNSADENSDWFLLRFIKRYREDLILLVFAFVVTISCIIYYLSTMLTISDPGLTLDDAWIHIQFARTIFEGTPWEYSPGYPSTGSTSPLWSLILSPIFFFTSDQFGIVWGTYIISSAFFVGCTYLTGRIVTNYVEHPGWGLMAMSAFVIIPRNAWLMLSGMETPLFVFVLLLSIWILDKQEMKYDLLIGIVAGVAYLSRPEGIIVAICIPIRFIMIALRGKSTTKRFSLFILSGVFAVIVVSPWVLQCLSTTGYPLPDTFYAKVHTPTASEIAAWDSWWVIFVNQMPYILLAVFLGVILVIKGKPFAFILPVSLTVLYRLFTPFAALINNARYLVPVFDLFIIVAIASSAILFKFMLTTRLDVIDDLLLNLTGILLLVVVIIIPMTPYYVLQTTNYGKAAGNINDMQVHLGYWLDENTPPDAVFATHDAGALRFFSGRKMIDLAGLVSPDIVHGNMTNYEKMQYLSDNGCNYFVFFDELFWYWSHFIPSNAYSKIYTVFLVDNVVSGRDTMSVFQIFWELTEFPANNP